MVSRTVSAMKILSVDDHWVARAGLKHLLQQLDERVTVLEADNLDDAIRLASEEQQLDLVLLDLMMPGMEAFSGLAALRDALPQIPIIVISMIEDRRDVLRAIELGAMGYIAKTASPDETLKAVRMVLAGEVYMPRALIKQVRVASASSNAEEARAYAFAAERLHELTKRQRDVLDLLKHGKTNAEIAKELGASENTVRLHVSAILGKLGFSNRTQAALFAAQHRDTVGASMVAMS